MTTKAVFDPMTVRRVILQLAAIGDARFVQGELKLIEREVARFGRARKLQLSVTPSGDGATITRLADKVHGLHAYPEIGRLEPDENVLIETPFANHQRVRLAASQQARRAGSLFRCQREGDAIRVWRIDGSEAALVPSQASKYGLERLNTERQLTFEVSRADRYKLRSACSFKASQTGWTIRCRLQDDSSMLVYRTDAGAPQHQERAQAAK